MNPQSASYRAMLAILAIMLAAVLYAWLVQSATKGRSKAKVAVSTLREQAVRLEQQATEYERMREKPAATAMAGNLVAIFEAQADHVGLPRASMRIDSVEANRIQVRIEAVSFSDWLTIAGSLQSMRLRLESCRIEAISNSRLVSITASVVRNRP